MNLTVIGTNFRTASLGFRESVAFATDEIPEILARAQAVAPDSEWLLLATCNRTELYVAGPAAAWPPRRLLALLVELPCDDTAGDVGETAREDSRPPEMPARGDACPPAGVPDGFYHHCGRAAARHLMEVAAGLDSMVLGETEIFGQIKQAYAMARDCGTLGPLLTPLLPQIFGVVKRVRSETEIAVGRVSVGSIAVDVAGQMFDTLSAMTVLIVGAGKIGEEAIRHLAARPVARLLIVNRSPDRAHTLAARYGGSAFDFERLPECLAEADIVLSSSAAPHALIHVETIRRVMATRPGRPMLLIDLAVPRNVEPEVGQIENVHLYNIDDLRTVAGENLARREAAAAHAREIIRDELAGWTGCACTAELAELMRALDGLAGNIADAEFARAVRKEKVAPDDEHCRECRDEMRIMLQRTLDKLLAAPRKALNDAAQHDAWTRTAATARALFGLDTDDTRPQERERDHNHEH